MGKKDSTAFPREPGPGHGTKAREAVSDRDEYSRDIKSLPCRLKGGAVWASFFVAASLLLSGCSGEDYGPELNAIRDRLKRLEERMEQMRYSDRKIARLEDQIQELKKSLEKLERGAAQKPRPQQYHTVRRGETLSGIARRYGMTVEEICNLNGISPKSIIRPGQRLLVSRARS